MTDSDKRHSGGDSSTKKPNEEKKENEKKKRSRVKQLLTDVKKQVEFWFGDANLHKDRFLKQLIVDSRDGYVDLSVLTTFNRMKKLTTDVKLIARALRNSSLVEINLEGTKLRRKHALGEDPKDVDERTVYVELLPKDATHGWLERVFGACGTIVYISLPRYKTTGHHKGFGFVEFQAADQAQKAVQMLNNPPEDAPRQAGIFPKTRKNKPLPQLGAADTTREEEEEEKKKKRKKKSRSGRKESAGTQATPLPMEATNQEEDQSGQEKQDESKSQLHSGGGVLEPEVGVSREKEAGSDQEGEGLVKMSTKRLEKKRRRSQSAETMEEGGAKVATDEMPAKMRKVEEEEESTTKVSEVAGDGGGDEKKKKGKEEKEEKEEKEDSLLKVKRKHKKKNKERLKIGQEVTPLRVLSKKEWLDLKQQYLQLQKRSMSDLKRTMVDIAPTPASSTMETDDQNHAESGKASIKKEVTSGPQFESGLIVKITHTQPLPGKKCVKETLSEFSAVVYVDILEGDAEGHVRFKTPQDAQAAMAAQPHLHKKHTWKLEILTGDHEQRYWQKILVDRQAKLNRPRDKKRGSEKLISKAEKIIVARAKEASKHIHFMDE